jgi:hypothetical protein
VKNVHSQNNGKYGIKDGFPNGALKLNSRSSATKFFVDCFEIPSLFQPNTNIEYLLLRDLAIFVTRGVFIIELDLIITTSIKLLIEFLEDIFYY